MERYHVLLTAPRTVTDDQGDATVQPAGTIINTVMWDGVTPYDPGTGCALVRAA